MARILSTLAGVAAIALAASAGTAAADCFGGHKDVTASVSQPQDGAAMSTFDGKLAPVAPETADEAKVAETVSTSGEQASTDQEKK